MRSCVVAGLTPVGQPPHRRQTRRPSRETSLCRVARRIEHLSGNRRDSLPRCCVVTGPAASHHIVARRESQQARHPCRVARRIEHPFQTSGNRREPRFRRCVWSARRQAGVMRAVTLHHRAVARGGGAMPRHENPHFACPAPAGAAPLAPLMPGLSPPARLMLAPLMLRPF